jgi:putrescine aminotransferase
MVEDVIARYQQYVNPGLARLMQFGGFGDVEVSAEGCVVTTATGARYLDYVGGFGTFTVGHRNPHVVAAVHRQLDLMPLSSKTFFNEPMARLAEKLAQLAPGDLTYSFLSNSGTEAVEAALKVARIATGKTDFISSIGSFHGKTMGSLAATGREKYRKPFEPMVPGFVQVPFDDLAAAEAAIGERTAAIIMEPIQGEGGIIPPSPGYLSGLRRICDRNGILLIADEVQTGLGRTGRFFACEHEGVVPDILVLAKALGGGVMPIGATIGKVDLWERAFAENPLIHTSTFGGNPLACAAALATLEVIELGDLPRRARELGARLISRLKRTQQQCPDAIVAVRGVGLMVGVEFAVEDVAELTINQMVMRGVIAAYTLNNPRVIRFEPPLIVSEEEIDAAADAFHESVLQAVEFLEGLEE